MKKRNLGGLARPQAENDQHGASALVVEVDENVVEHERHGFVRAGVPLETGEAKRQIQLVARAVAQRVDADGRAVWRATARTSPPPSASESKPTRSAR